MLQFISINTANANSTYQTSISLDVNGPFVHPKNFKRLCMGTKYPHVQYQILRNSWLSTVSRITCSCTGIQAEYNKLFFVIIKCVFVEIFRKFQRHCFYGFPLDLHLQWLWEGLQRLLVINLMRAVRRGGCDSTVALVTMIVDVTANIPGAGDVSLAENLSTQCVNQTCKLQGIPSTDDTDVISLPQGPFANHASSRLPLKLQL